MTLDTNLSYYPRMGIQLPPNDLQLADFYRALRYVRKLAPISAGQYVSAVRSFLAYMSGPEDSIGLTSYLAMLAPSSRVRAASVYAAWLLFHRASDELKGYDKRAPFPSEEAIHRARSARFDDTLTDRPPIEILTALRLLSAITEVGPARVAARQWGDVEVVTGQLLLKVQRGGRGKVYHQLLGPLGAEALATLKKYTVGDRQPVPHAVLLPIHRALPCVPPTRYLVEQWLHTAGVPLNSAFREAVEANVAALPEVQHGQ